MMIRSTAVCRYPFPIFAVLPLLLACPPGTGPVPVPGHTSTTNSAGEVKFVDQGTSEDVTIQVENDSGAPLSDIRVQFLDGSGFEAFILEDPQGRYETTLALYEHNSPHLIKMLLRDGVPDYEQVPDASAKGVAAQKLANNIRAEGNYVGQRTPTELDNEPGDYAFLLRLPGRDYTILSNSAGRIGAVSDQIDGWNEPAFYDVYELPPQTGIATIVRVLAQAEGNGLVVIDFSNIPGESWDGQDLEEAVLPNLDLLFRDGPVETCGHGNTPGEDAQNLYYWVSYQDGSQLGFVLNPCVITFTRQAVISRVRLTLFSNKSLSQTQIVTAFASIDGTGNPVDTATFDVEAGRVDSFDLEVFSNAGIRSVLIHGTSEWRSQTLVAGQAVSRIEYE